MAAHENHENSVHFKERKSGFLVPKRHQMKHLDLDLPLVWTRESEVQTLPLKYNLSRSYAKPLV